MERILEDQALIIKAKVDDCKRKFHQGRSLLVKDLPNNNITVEEIRHLIRNCQVGHIWQSFGEGSSSVVVEIDDPEVFECWNESKVFLFRGQPVSVSPSPSINLLWVNNLPLKYTEEQFHGLVKSFGTIQRYFLMISELTGSSKGCGFVEYKSRKVAVTAKMNLNKKQIEKHSLTCDWLDSRLTKFESLHSKCLYVDRLPHDLSMNMSKFKKMFSLGGQDPLFCCTARRSGLPQDWGIIEYINSKEAELHYFTLNSYIIEGYDISVIHAPPGKCGMMIYMEKLNEHQSQKDTKGMFRTPSNRDVLDTFKNLYDKNPVFAKEVQCVISSKTSITTTTLTSSDRNLSVCWKRSQVSHQSETCTIISGPSQAPNQQVHLGAPPFPHQGSSRNIHPPPPVANPRLILPRNPESSPVNGNCFKKRKH